MSHTPARRPRALAWLVALGLALVAAPFAFQMFSRAPQGADMLDAFAPFMTQERLAGFQTDIADIDAAVQELDSRGTARLGRLDDVSPAYVQLSREWPGIHDDMGSLLDDVQANRENYLAVAGLPSFRLFPWFFVVPGVLVAGLALWGLRRPSARRGVAVVTALVGVGLVLAPVVFGMFWRAPKGGEMMSAFKTIETTQNVERIQGYLSTMASGQGAIRLDVVPALERSGWSAADVAEKLPHTTHLNEQWVHILNDMTPMIGAMSDSVSRFQAISALPPFPLFPWFFVIPGVLVVALSVLSLRTPRPAPRGES